MPRTQRMQRTSHQFLARSRFTEQEHSGVGRSDDPRFLQNLSQCGAFSNNVFKSQLGSNLRLKV